MGEVSRKTRELVELFVKTNQIDPVAYEKAKKLSEEAQKKHRARLEGAPPE